MAKVVSNKKQMEKLVSLMEANPDIAKGVCTKGVAKNRWEKFAAELNSLGPPVRTWDKWIKVWTDLKCKIKKKKTANKMEIQATGGGPNRLHTFSSLEESVISLLSINASINPPGLEFGQDASVYSYMEDKENEPMQTEEELRPIDNAENDDLLACDKPTRVIGPEKKHRKTKEVDQRIELLTKQTSTFEKFYDDIKITITGINEKLSNLEDYSRKIYYLKKDTQDKHKELLEIKKEKLRLYKDELQSRQKDRCMRLKLMQQKLEMKKSLIDLQIEML